MEYQTYEVTEDDTDSRMMGPKWKAFMWPLISSCIVSVPLMLNFPVVMFANGGAAFLVPFLLIGLLLMSPLVFVQLKLGGITEGNIVTMFGRSIPVLKGVGIAMLIHLSIGAILEQMTSAYTMVYAYHSLQGKPLPWAGCEHAWNTPLCQGPAPPNMAPPTQGANGGLSNVSVVMGFDGNMSSPYQPAPPMQPSPNMPPPHTPAKEYFLFVFTKIYKSSGFAHFGAIIPYIAGAMGISWLVVFLIACWGPRIYGWLALILSMGSFSILFLMVGRGHQALEAFAQTGMDTMYHPSWEQLTRVEVWFRGLHMALAFTGVTQGSLPTFGKFVGGGKVSSNVAWIPIVIIAMILPNILVIMMSPFLAFLAHVYSKPFFQVMGPGNDLVYINIPDMTALMPSGILGFFFYLWIFLQNIIHLSFVVLVLQDALVEGFREVLQRVCHRKFVARLPVCAVLCLVFFLLSLPLATEGGLYIANLVSSFNWLLTCLIYLLACIAFVITYVKQTHLSRCERIVMPILFSLKSLCVVVVSAIGAYWVVENLPLTMGAYIYSETSSYVGWAIAIGPLVVGLVVGVIHALCTANGTMGKRVAFLFRGAPVPRRRRPHSKEAVVTMRPVGGLGGQNQPLMNDKKPDP